MQTRFIYPLSLVGALLVAACIARPVIPIDSEQSRATVGEGDASPSADPNDDDQDDADDKDAGGGKGGKGKKGGKGGKGGDKDADDDKDEKDASPGEAPK